MKNTLASLSSIAAAIGLLAGCAGQKQTPERSGFLSHYHHLKPVDETTSRYVNAQRLGSYNKFKITSIQVLIKEYDGKPITVEQQQKITDYIRNSITAALQDKYPVVQNSGADTAELRVAITSAYKSGSQLGISLEGEILDSFSAVQVAAVVRTDLGSRYLGDWWDSESAKEIVDGWSQRLRQAIDSAH